MEEIISLRTYLRINSRMYCMRLLMSGLRAEKCKFNLDGRLKLYLTDCEQSYLTDTWSDTVCFYKM